MHQEIRLPLVETMACHLFGTKPLSVPLLIYCRLNHQENNAVNLCFEENTF